MAIARVYSAGWGFGDTGTSAQGNALDIAAASLLDKQPGAGDQLGSVVGATGAGRIISTVATGTDADQTFHAWGQNAIVRVPTLTAARSYQLGLSGVTGGDRMFFYIEGTGSTASGYADIKNSVGTAIYRLGLANGASGSSFLAEGETVEVIFSDASSEWQVEHAVGRGPTLRGRYYTSSTTWVCPPGVYAIVLEGWGGGGGGAGGAVGLTLQYAHHGGGGGGGGARIARRRVAVVPGRTYTITIGAGGTGGAAGTGGIDGRCGGNGGDTIFTETASGNVLATFRGAEGGFPCRSRSTNTNETMLDQSFGGRPVRPTVTGAGTFTCTAWCPTGLFAAFSVFETPSRGGMGASVRTAQSMRQGQYGRANERFAGGVAGTAGSSSGDFNGGGGGGGGGAGPGAPGGNGGTGSDSGSSTATAGAAGAANSGAGGGGGGGGSYSGNAGGAGGAGGSGMLILTTVG